MPQCATVAAVAMQWLGDLPNAGFATKREKQLSDAMMFFLRSLERDGEDGDRRLLLMMVIEGYDVFEPRMLRAWRAFRVTQDEIREVWRYMVRLAGPNPQQQLANLIAIRPWGEKLTDEQIRAIERGAGQ